MTSAVVFLGPTLPLDEARAVLDAQYLPPAGNGDVLRAALRRPRAIALVDGVFERVPAVWHKEILFALSEGIHVYGASSMGALRAAELDRFGMRGVGEVYRAYADGTLEDDDEVAVAHGDADHGFAAVSDAMVDVRATLDAAVENGVVSGDAATAIAARVKATFYPRRLLAGVLDPSDEEHERLRAWLPEGWVRRKRDDAIALLRTIRDHLAAGLEPARPAWTLQQSCFWLEARRSVELAADGRPDHVQAHTADAELEAILDELRLDPDRYLRLVERSLLVALARKTATDAGVDLSPWAHQDALDQERRDRGLLAPEEARAWLNAQGLSEADLPAVARRLAALDWARRTHRDSVAGEVALAVRSDDDYAGLASRAAHKREVLASLPATAGGDDGDDELIARYFRERLVRQVPPALEEWASAHGWRRTSDLVRALRAEFVYEGLVAHGDGSRAIDAGEPGEQVPTAERAVGPPG